MLLFPCLAKIYLERSWWNLTALSQFEKEQNSSAAHAHPVNIWTFKGSHLFKFCRVVSEPITFFLFVIILKMWLLQSQRESLLSAFFPICGQSNQNPRDQPETFEHFRGDAVRCHLDLCENWLERWCAVAPPLGGVAKMTSALSEGHNSIYALTLCHYILYLNETAKPGEVGHAVKLRVGEALRCLSPQTTRHYWGLQQRCHVACWAF